MQSKEYMPTPRKKRKLNSDISDDEAVIEEIEHGVEQGIEQSGEEEQDFTFLFNLSQRFRLLLQTRRVIVTATCWRGDGAVDVLSIMLEMLGIPKPVKIVRQAFYDQVRLEFGKPRREQRLLCMSVRSRSQHWMERTLFANSDPALVRWLQDAHDADRFEMRHSTITRTQHLRLNTVDWTLHGQCCKLLDKHPDPQQVRRQLDSDSKARQPELHGQVQWRWRYIKGFGRSKTATRVHYPSVQMHQAILKGVE